MALRHRRVGAELGQKANAIINNLSNRYEAAPDNLAQLREELGERMAQLVAKQQEKPKRRSGLPQ